MHLKYLVTPPQGWTFFEAVSRFNANVPYSGLIHSVTADHLFAENKEKLIHSAMLSLINKSESIDPRYICSLLISKFIKYQSEKINVHSVKL